MGEEDKKKTIEIIPGAKGDLSYTPALLHASRGNTIEWTCGNSRPLAIQFTRTSPLIRAEFHSGDPDLKVRPDAKPGAYRYAVAVFADGKVYLDAACPAIIID
jgi:plastocyanin